MGGGLLWMQLVSLDLLKLIGSLFRKLDSYCVSAEVILEMDNKVCWRREKGVMNNDHA